MSWRVVVIESQSKLDYKMGYLVVRGLETKRVLLDEIAVLLINYECYTNISQIFFSGNLRFEV